MLATGASSMRDHRRTVASYEAEPTTRQGGAMPSQEQVSQWVDGYRTAWESNDPNDIGRLFTEQALSSRTRRAAAVSGRQIVIDPVPSAPPLAVRPFRRLQPASDRGRPQRGRVDSTVGKGGDRD